MTKRGDVLSEIAHKKLMLKFTLRAIKEPPKDDTSQMMLRQAARIEEEIRILKSLLKVRKAPKRAEKKKGKR